MSADPTPCAVDELFVKPFVRELLLDRSNKGRRNSAFNDTQRKINQITLAKNIDERYRVFSDAMMQVDHFAYLRCPICETVPVKIVRREIDGRRQIVKRVRRPDAEIVKTARDDQLFSFLRAQIALGETEIEHSVNMIPVTGIITSQIIPVFAQNVFNQRNCCFDHLSRRAETAVDPFVQPVLNVRENVFFSKIVEQIVIVAFVKL